MDAIILAGGKGSRLDGAIPPYLKPIIPVQGVPLINRALDQANAYASRTFVVVAPENALQISQVIGARPAFLIVQRQATGPGDALMLALTLTKAQAVLVLMADNIIPDDDVHRVYRSGAHTGYAIGTNVVTTSDEASRFTRIYDQGRYIEEGELVSKTDDGSDYMVWCGPLVLPVEKMMNAMRRHSEDDNEAGERKIGTHLTYIEQTPILVPCSSIDIGTPTALTEVQV